MAYAAIIDSLEPAAPPLQSGIVATPPSVGTWMAPSAGLLVVAIVALMLSRAMKRIAEQQLSESRINRHLGIYATVVKEHHTFKASEMRALFREVAPLEAAKKAGKTIWQCNEGYGHRLTSAINYYEGLGLLLEHGHTLMPRQSVEMLLDMLHESTVNLVILINDYLPQIAPEHARSSDWAKSAWWLSVQCLHYKSKTHKWAKSPGRAKAQRAAYERIKQEAYILGDAPGRASRIRRDTPSEQGPSEHGPPPKG